MLGPSGAGKSTLALALAGLLGRDVPGAQAGEISVGGPVGVVFQDPASQIVMERVEDDVAFGLENLGWPAAAMHRRVPESLAEVGLRQLARHRTTTLSGGQQQRLALASAAAPRPAVLVLDEPTANLDLEAARAFVDRIAALHRARSATIVLVEHRVDLVWTLADRVLVLGRDGRPAALGPPDAVVRAHGRLLAEAGVWLPEAIERAVGISPLAPFHTVGGGQPLVAAEEVRFAYPGGPSVVRDVDLAVGAADRVTVIGPNGSGKSTLARLLVGLLRPSSGRVRLLGDAPHRLSAAVLARRAGFVFQDPQRQFLAATVADEAALGLRAEERTGLPDILDRLGFPLDQFGERSPYGLSGGEQRRLSLVGLLARRPPLLVLDEPTFGQDRLTYLGLLELLRERLEAGAGLVAVTHDPRLVADLGGRVLAMIAGRLEPVEGRVE